ncbi:MULTISPECIES: ABC transporter ATP-binding protein [unclassified Isoptericola]|uniref:ABC transporter ATP-binding protein n=1 Tax=unclassified Isoptericola TaxID=2623355 RepID=UPI002713E85C|nr:MULTISPECIES: ABC transporter ATP-binding protein [unclassified Isoptericola]MDO8145591.1 ABC transporter ATP-binding protein [Isoptericola sp. 178]MDO8149213.1 ABC transporter ATP-binding protein [Isoptericola sp. b515]MDO8152152.1 ABC transporter ATP-binding protein [Isoptericola sp. b408]
MDGPVVEVSHLRKTYGDKVAVDDVSFSVRPGEIFGILGPNGAGKTTAVETIAGMRRADGGTTRVLGHDTQRDPGAVRDRLGIQLQEATLHDRITVGEAVRLFAAFYPRPADPADLLALLDLTEHADKQFRNLSGGQKQRLSIALALVGNPEVAILDELTTGLDPQARRSTWDLVDRVRATGVTILLVTHFMDEAERLCDRLVVIDAGRVVAEGTPRGLIDGLQADRTVVVRFAEGTAAPARAVLDRLTETHPDVHGVAPGSDGEVAVTGSRRVLFAVMPALAEADLVPDDIRTVTRTLEDVFLAVTGRTYAEQDDEDEPALATEGDRS